MFFLSRLLDADYFTQVLYSQHNFMYNVAYQSLWKTDKSFLLVVQSEVHKITFPAVNMWCNKAITTNENNLIPLVTLSFSFSQKWEREKPQINLGQDLSLQLCNKDKPSWKPSGSKVPSTRHRHLLRIIYST